MRTRVATLVLLSGLTNGLACGPPPPAPVVAKPPPPKPKGPAAPPVGTPARWILPATAGATYESKLEVEGIGTLYVGHGGERWLEKKAGVIVPAETLLAEPLRGIARDGDKWMFIGARGTVFVTKDPIGPVIETRAPSAALGKLRSLAFGKRAIVALSAKGMVRSADFGASWSPVALPKVDGTLLQVALLGTGEGLALFAPQKIFATTDDGASWSAIGTPGIGARRVVADVNGELVLEGVTASAVLRTSPLRLDKVAHAASVAHDLPFPETTAPPLLGSEAVINGTAALYENRYAEAFQDPDHPELWRLAIAELGKPPTVRVVSELEGCDRVHVAARGSTMILGCATSNDHDTGSGNAPTKKWSPPSGQIRYQLRLLESTDGGATFKEAGTLHASDADKRMWLAPDGTLVVDGACKRDRSGWECADSPPVVRLPGAKGVAKAVNQGGTHFDRVVFAGNSAWAYAVGRDPNGRMTLFVSKNGGKDFARKALPPAVVADGQPSVSPTSEYAALAVDDAGNVHVLARADRQRLIRWTASADGNAMKAQVVEVGLDAFDLHGSRGFGYDDEGVGYETVDAGASWHRVAAPTYASSQSDRLVACGAYGCVIGEHAVRVGWDVALGAPPPKEAAPKGPKKLVHRTPIRCIAEGAYTTLGTIAMPNTLNADLATSARWVLAKRDAQKGGLAAVVSTTGPKGIESKEVALFGAAPADSAGTVVMQVEGVAAIRYAFKRDKAAAPAPMPPPKYPSPMPPSGIKPKPYMPAPSSKVPPITPKQTVDVEVSWWVAATNKVHRATIKAAGEIDPSRDVVDARELPSLARYSLLSIAKGGIHVRPFASAGAESPLYFVGENGKVEKLGWPEIPNRDVRGGNLTLRLDAARVGGKSVVFGETSYGLQIFLARALTANGSSWESRFWGLWPSLEDVSGAPSLRFVDSGDRPVVGVLWPGSPDLPAAGWAVGLEGGKNEPEVLAPLPTQAMLSDPPKACAKGTPATSAGGFRVPSPYSLGSRHPVIVTQEGAELLLATSNVIARTGPKGEDVCVSALDAYYTVWKSGDLHSALIPPDDLAHATLFKTAGGQLSFRPMSCTLTPGAIPESYASVPGFTP